MLGTPEPLRVMDQMFTTWNRILSWVRLVEALKPPRSRLPDSNAVLRRKVELVSRAHAERVGPRVDVADYAVHAKFGRTMWISEDQLAEPTVARLPSPRLSVAKKDLCHQRARRACLSRPNQSLPSETYSQANEADDRCAARTSRADCARRSAASLRACVLMPQVRQIGSEPGFRNRPLAHERRL